jgi:hypothetical protein
MLFRIVSVESSFSERKVDVYDGTYSIGIPSGGFEKDSGAVEAADRGMVRHRLLLEVLGQVREHDDAGILDLDVRRLARPGVVGEAEILELRDHRVEGVHPIVGSARPS